MNDTIDNETGEVTERREMVVADEGLRTQIARMDKQFAAALPPHIPVERFTRVVQTALTGNPDLQKADRASLFEAAMKAAQDGLLPDGRDGALVIFNTKVKREGKDIWIKKVQWMPMVGGILKKVRNSGELLSISAHVVYTKDKFFYSLGDEEKIEHTPLLDEDRGVPMCVYAIAKTKDGGIYREVMTLKDVEKVRNVSKAKDSGPWTQWWDEMARKSVIRRLAKRLPTSADLDDLLRHDDELYDFSGKRDEPAPFTPVTNPLKDDPAPERIVDQTAAAKREPAQTTAKSASSESAGKSDPISSGTGPSARAIASATTLIDKDGTVVRSQHGDIEPVIIDQRFPPAKQVFMSAEAWSAATDGMPEPEFQDQQDDNGSETASSEGENLKQADKASEAAVGAASAAKGADGPAKTETAQASPAKAAKADQKTYEDATGYMKHMQGIIDSATSKGAVIEAWGATRADRNALLSPEQIDELTADKEAKLKAFKLAEGK